MADTNLAQSSETPSLFTAPQNQRYSTRIEGQRILIRNQLPLDPYSLDLGATVTLEEYVACLNSFVYFWPGTALGPRENGVRMFERTNGAVSVVIRVSTRSLIDVNRDSLTYVATCNTGAAWTEQGLPEGVEYGTNPEGRWSPFFWP